MPVGAPMNATRSIPAGDGIGFFTGQDYQRRLVFVSRRGAMVEGNHAPSLGRVGQ
jgi:hypothetical protein